MYSEEDLDKNAHKFFNSNQQQSLNNFFQRHGETVHNIFKNTTTTSGVMVLFIVINGLSDKFKDFLFSLKPDPKKPILLPTSYDNVLLKRYLLRIEKEYVLKCKECDFISYITYTMEHMAFVHNIHHGFGLTMKYSLNNIPNIKRCIFETPNSDKSHLFRDHFTFKYCLKNEKQYMTINENHNNRLSQCYNTYKGYLEDNGKLYTIDRCEHEKQIIRRCECMNKTIDFYKRFHNEIFELFKIVGLTNFRKDTFKSCGLMNPCKYTKKNIKIFEIFEPRIVKVYSDFFPKDNDNRYTNPTKAEMSLKSANSIEVIEISDSSNSSFASDISVNPDKAPEQDTIEDFLNKNSKIELNESNPNFFDIPVEYVESFVEDSSKISYEVQMFKNDVLGGSQQCDPMEEYKVYESYNNCLSMLKSEHEKSIEQLFKMCQNEPNEDIALSILKRLDSGDQEMNVVQLQTENDYEDVLNQYSAAHKLNCLFLNELNNPNVGSAIFGDILNESIESIKKQTE